jgi:hypothetical protein
MVAKKEIEEIYSKSVRSGRRTYFFDVRSTEQKIIILQLQKAKEILMKTALLSIKNIRYIFTKKILKVFKMLLQKSVNSLLKKKDPKLFLILNLTKQLLMKKMREPILHNQVSLK